MWTLQISLKEIDDHFTELFCIIETNVFLSFRCDIHLTDSAGVERGVAAPYGIKAALAYTRQAYMSEFVDLIFKAYLKYILIAT